MLNIQSAYCHLEKRHLSGSCPPLLLLCPLAAREIDDLPPHMLGGIYQSEMVIHLSNPLDEDMDADDLEAAQEDEKNKRKQLKLPTDGGIFREGIPFHHFAVTPLQEKHINRLRRNGTPSIAYSLRCPLGVEISHRRFSREEDAQLRANWRSWAREYQLPEEEAYLYMSAAAAKESSADHLERIRFIKENHFRPWMCKRLLNRTCGQIFRRCYHLFQPAAEGTAAEGTAMER